MSSRVGIAASVLLVIGCGGIPRGAPPVPTVAVPEMRMVCTGESPDVRVDHRYEIIEWSSGAVTATCHAMDDEREASSSRDYLPGEEGATAAWAECSLDLRGQMPKVDSRLWTYRSHRALRTAGVTYGGIDPGYPLNCRYEAP